MAHAWTRGSLPHACEDGHWDLVLLLLRSLLLRGREDLAVDSEGLPVREVLRHLAKPILGLSSDSQGAFSVGFNAFLGS